MLLLMYGLCVETNAIYVCAYMIVDLYYFSENVVVLLYRYGFVLLYDYGFVLFCQWLKS